MLRGSQILLALLIKAFVPDGARLTFVIDETLERRTGRSIKLAGWFRDAVRSTEKTTVTSRGVRWLVLSLIIRPAWSNRAWALPILSIPLPAKIERQKTGLKKISTRYSCQLICLLRRWYPQREIVIVADGGFAVHQIYLRALWHRVVLITRCRQDLVLCKPLVKPLKKPPGRPWTHGPRLPLLSKTAADLNTLWTEHGTSEMSYQDGEWHRGRTKASPVSVRCVLVREKASADKGPGPVLTLTCTDQSFSPGLIADLYQDRWSTEVTFQETRAHLGFETGRGWSDNTIARTTPMLLALFSCVILMANTIWMGRSIVVRQASWYQKTDPTFIDALAVVRRSLWSESIYATGRKNPLVKQLKVKLARSMLDTLCYAA